VVKLQFSLSRLEIATKFRGTPPSGKDNAQLSGFIHANAAWSRNRTEPTNARRRAKTGGRPAKQPDGPPPPGMRWCWRKCSGWVPIERFEGRDTIGCGNCLRFDQVYYLNRKKKQSALKAAQQDESGKGYGLPRGSIF
jgi:hypothetical protein